MGNTNKNPRTDGGYTPLHIAARNGHLRICRIILEEVDDKNPVANDGLTPLYLAATNKHLEIFNIIYENVSTINSKKNEEYCHLIHTNIAEISLLGLMWSRLKNLWK